MKVGNLVKRVKHNYQGIKNRHCGIILESGKSTYSKTQTVFWIDGKVYRYYEKSLIKISS